MMLLVVGGLHLAGFLTLIELVLPHRYRVGSAGAITLGIGFAAYTLGLRHAFDADHIAAIDNTTRKLMSEGQRPLSIGFWFSLGHSTIVFGLALLISLGVRSLSGPIRNGSSQLHHVVSMARSATPAATIAASSRPGCASTTGTWAGTLGLAGPIPGPAAGAPTEPAIWPARWARRSPPPGSEAGEPRAALAGGPQLAAETAGS
jgi:nickel/cobalt transporter (NiCoT) family protein